MNSLIVIPGRGLLAASPESITPVGEYGFRVRSLALAPRNDG
jgi:hypothetical protein